MWQPGWKGFEGKMDTCICMLFPFLDSHISVSARNLALGENDQVSYIFAHAFQYLKEDHQEIFVKQDGIPAALKSCSASLTLVCYGHNVVLFLFTCLLLLVCFEYNSLKKNSTTFLPMWFLIFLIEYSSYNIKFTFNVYTLVVLNNSPSCVIITTV